MALHRIDLFTAEQQPIRTTSKQAHLFANPAASVIATLSIAIALYAASAALHQPDMQAGVPACLDAGFAMADCEAWAKKSRSPAPSP